MIYQISGNILQAKITALVNPVNCVGIMGKGLALQFKKSFPANFLAYQQACQSKRICPGLVFTFHTNSPTNPRFIINFPTKRHWREKSRLEDIQTGLISLVSEIKTHSIDAIAIPPLGCGLGGLSWNLVYPLIAEVSSELPNTTILLYTL